MEEINSIVQNNAEAAKNANEITQKAQLSVVDSRTELLDTVNNSIETNQEMLQNLQSTNSSVVTAMEEIMESSKKIEGITTLMNDIAFQTNLLALNASVEAARAGRALWGREQRTVCVAGTSKGRGRAAGARCSSRC